MSKTKTEQKKKEENHVRQNFEARKVMINEA